MYAKTVAVTFNETAGREEKKKKFVKHGVLELTQPQIRRQDCKD